MTRSLRNCFLLLSLLLLISSCKKEEKDYYSSEVMTLTIDANLLIYIDLDGNHTLNMVAQSELEYGTSHKLYIQSITGFQYEPGYQYVLQVRKKKLSQYPSGESGIRYELMHILKKAKAKN